jgi:hypothetical protein
MADYLSKTYASAGNRRTFTISTWLKITNISTATGQSIFYGDTAGSTNGTNDDFYYANNKIYFGGYNSTYIISTALFRDVAAWYHIVLSVDTTQATSANRIKLYVNGVEQARSEGAGYPAQNFETAFIKSGAFQICGNSPASGFGLFNLASFYYIDGTALTPSSFGETDATTGIWKPKSYSGSYGTNGFFLKFESSGSLGTDSSGNGNNFTVNGTPTQTVDTPSNVFATGNPLYRASNNNTFTNGNLTFTGSGESYPVNIATFQPTAGKWYWETKIITKTTNPIIGMAWNGYTSGGTGRVAYRADGAIITHDGNELTGYSSFTNNDIIGCALDLNSGTTTLKFYKNNTLIYTYNNIATVLEYSTRGEGMIFFQLYTSDVISANFGNGYFGTTVITSPNSDGAGLGKFQYAVPSGYYALCTKNINVYG